MACSFVLLLYIQLTWWTVGAWKRSYYFSTKTVNILLPLQLLCSILVLEVISRLLILFCFHFFVFYYVSTLMGLVLCWSLSLANEVRSFVSSSKISPDLKRVATLPREISMSVISHKSTVCPPFTHDLLSSNILLVITVFLLTSVARYGCHE